MLSRLRDLAARLRYPDPTDTVAVQDMTARTWAGMAGRPTYEQAYRYEPGVNNRANRRARWLADLPCWRGVGSVLELGCGMGRNLAMMVSPMRVSGLDINLEAIAACRRILPTGRFEAVNLYDLTTLSSADAILTVGCLGHLEPATVARLLGLMLGAARQRVVLVEEEGEGEIAKGPRSWGAERSTGAYILWRHNYAKLLLAAGAREVTAVGLPDDLQAPAARTLFIVERG